MTVVLRLKLFVALLMEFGRLSVVRTSKEGSWTRVCDKSVRNKVSSVSFINYDCSVGHLFRHVYLPFSFASLHFAITENPKSNHAESA
jgi:hypothetical protein